MSLITWPLVLFHFHAIIFQVIDGLIKFSRKSCKLAFINYTICSSSESLDSRDDVWKSRSVKHLSSYRHRHWVLFFSQVSSYYCQFFCRAAVAKSSKQANKNKKERMESIFCDDASLFLSLLGSCCTFLNVHYFYWIYSRFTCGICENRVTSTSKSIFCNLILASNFAKNR